MPQRPYLLAKTNWKAAREIEYQLAVLPWGATEAHNYHLPYATDCIQCDYVAAEAARKAWERGAKVMVLPTVPFGVDTGHLGIKGVINMRPSTQAAVLRDVVESLSHQDIDKLVVLNGHGGNNFKALIREVQVDFSDVFVCLAHWFRVGDPSEYFDLPGDHAGELETSVMLHVAPDLVRSLSEAGDGAARTFAVEALHEDWAWAERHWPSITDDTGVGNPKAATAEKGEAYLNEVTARLAEFFTDLAAANRAGLYV